MTIHRSHMALPTLTDGRVLLRASEPRDEPAIEAGIHDPDVVRWIGPPELSARAALDRYAERWARGSPTLSICEPDGTCVGLIWLRLREPGASTGYVGYWLLPTARGRGFATTAVRLLSRWAVRELGITDLRLRTAPENRRSQRVAERSGFQRVPGAPDEILEGTEGRQLVYALNMSSLD